MDKPRIAVHHPPWLSRSGLDTDVIDVPDEAKPIEVNLRALSLILLSLIVCSPGQAGSKFSASEITGPGAELLICDLDGDGLKDLVLMDDTNLSIFFQDSKRGFPRDPQQTCRLEPRPSLVWTAKLGGPAASLLVMTSDGVTELRFTNRTGPPD